MIESRLRKAEKQEDQHNTFFYRNLLTPLSSSSSYASSEIGRSSPINISFRDFFPEIDDTDYLTYLPPALDQIKNDYPELVHFLSADSFATEYYDPRRLAEYIWLIIEKERPEKERPEKVGLS